MTCHLKELSCFLIIENLSVSLQLRNAPFKKGLICFHSFLQFCLISDNKNEVEKAGENGETKTDKLESYHKGKDHENHSGGLVNYTQQVSTNLSDLVHKFGR